ncbi:MAG: sirohydrochlorin chelatase [Mycobacterium sp.]
MQLILTAHGSADPRSAANAREVARTVAALRRDVDVKVAFCEQNSPNLREALADSPAGGVVVPLLLADAYHARIDIPEMIAGANPAVLQAGVLGEDDRLIHVLSQRLTHCGVSRLDSSVGVLVTAVGSSSAAANARTAAVATGLVAGTVGEGGGLFHVGRCRGWGGCGAGGAGARG